MKIIHKSYKFRIYQMKSKNTFTTRCHCVRICECCARDELPARALGIVFVLLEVRGCGWVRIGWGQYRLPAVLPPVSSLPDGSSWVIARSRAKRSGLRFLRVQYGEYSGWYIAQYKSPQRYHYWDGRMWRRIFRLAGIRRVCPILINWRMRG